MFGTRNRGNGHQTSGNLHFGVMSPNLTFLVPLTMSLWYAEKEERMVSTCVAPTLKRRSTQID